MYFCVAVFHSRSSRSDDTGICVLNWSHPKTAHGEIYKSTRSESRVYRKSSSRFCISLALVFVDSGYEAKPRTSQAVYLSKLFHERTNVPFYWLTLAGGWGVRGSNAGGGEIFLTPPDRPWVPSSLLYDGFQVSFPGVERSGRGVNHPTHRVPRLRKE